MKVGKSKNFYRSAIVKAMYNGKVICECQITIRNLKEGYTVVPKLEITPPPSLTH